MDFIPDTPKQSTDVPYFDDVTSDAGWQGHSTSKSLETLKSEITASIGRLGGMITGFQRGIFSVGDKQRDGFRLHYVVEAPDGRMAHGQIDIAALPVKSEHRLRRYSGEANRREQSLRMALYMLRDALNGTWFLQQLSPGYAALVPWMIARDGKTITQLWSESATMGNLLPPGEGEFIDGDYKETQ